MMTVNEARVAAMRYVVRHALEDLDDRKGWCRWLTGDEHPWVWADYEPLVADGLLEKKEGYKDVLLRPTPAGWTALSTAWGKSPQA